MRRHFDFTTPIHDDDERDSYMKALMNGTEEDKAFLRYMVKERLTEISRTEGAKTTTAEDRYIAWALNDTDKALQMSAKTVIMLQLKTYITQEVRKFHVSYDESQDMEQDAYESVLTALPKYNGKTKAVTFFRMYVKDALIRHIGVIDYASNKKWRLWLQGAIATSVTRLKMIGIDHPTTAQIVAFINRQNLYRPVTEKNVLEAMNLKKTVFSLDEKCSNTSDDSEGRSWHETVADSSPSPEDSCTEKAGKTAIMRKLDEIIASLDTVMQYIWQIRLQSFEERGKDATNQMIIETIKAECPNYTQAFIKSAMNRFDTVMCQKMMQYEPNLNSYEHSVERIMEILSEM